MKFGLAYEDLVQNRIDREFLRASAALGPDHVWKFVYLGSIWPEPDRWDFAKLDDDIAAIREAGMEPYLRIIGCPAHASEGFPTYEQYGCSVAINNGMELRFKTEAPYCINPPHIDRGKMREAGRVIGARYRPSRSLGVKIIAIGNEPGGHDFWPPVHGGDVDGAFDRLVTEVYDPFAVGLAEVGYRGDDGEIVGCDAQGGDEQRRLMDTFGSHWSRFTVHQYLKGDVEKFHHEMNHYAVRIREYCARVGRDPKGSMWLSETGGPDHAAVIRECMARYADLMYGFSFYFRPDMPGMWFDRVRLPVWPDRAEAYDYTPNANGLALKAAIAEINGTAAVDPELARLRKMERDHATFSALLSAEVADVRNSDLRTLVALCANVGSATGSIDQHARDVMTLARVLDAALAAKRRAMRS